MIDFKNYERLSDKEFVKKLQKHYYGDHDKRDIIYLRLAELEDMIEQGKLVEKIEPKSEMTKERVEIELVESIDKKNKMLYFLLTDKYDMLSTKSQELLIKQLGIMIDYVDILEERLNNWEE